MLNERQIDAMDRRLAAIHEAGHVIVAMHFGLLSGYAWITPNEARSDEIRFWIGSARFPGAICLNEMERPMLACAGAVAEACWKRGCVDSIYWGEPDFMSPPDWRLAGCQPGEPDPLCERAIQHLEPLLSEDGILWSSLLRVARRLIVKRWVSIEALWKAGGVPLSTEAYYEPRGRSV